MDLLATVRKEGSRGGQGDFSWSDVQNSSRREHYLGHSLMAPVGRWAKGRDLSWYAKGNENDPDGEDAAEKAARERKEEIQRVKQAEEDALARALGLPVPVRNNANLEPVSDKREVDKVLKEVTSQDEESGRGVGFGSSAASGQGVTSERIQGNAETQDKELQYALKEYKRRHGLIGNTGGGIVTDLEIDHETDEKKGLGTDLEIDLEIDKEIDQVSAIVEGDPGPEVQTSMSEGGVVRDRHDDLKKDVDVVDTATSRCHSDHKT